MSPSPKHPADPKLTGTEEDEQTVTSNSYPDAVAGADLEKSLSKEEAEKPPLPSQTKLPTKIVILICASLCLSVLLAALDQTIVTTALPRLASEFDALSLYAWVGTAFQITFTAFQPLYGSLSDIFGRKPTFLFCVVVFLAASAVCGAANSMIMLIIFRAIQGIGGGGLFGLALIILADITTPEEQGKYQGLIGAAFTVASIIGPLLGGVFTDRLSWRWCFYVNLPIGAVALLMIFFTLRLPSPKGSLLSKFKRIDFLGSLAIIALTVCLMLAISFGGNEFAWNSPVVIVLFIVGVLLIGVFVFVEWKFAAEPVLPLRLFKNRDYVVLSVVNFFFGIGFFLGFFYYSLYFQLLGASATGSGLKTLPLSLVLIAVNIICGFAVSYTKKLRPFIWAGFVFMLLGAGLVTTFNEHTSDAMQIGYTVIVGFGLGFEVQNLLLATQIAVEPKDIPVATSSGMFFRTLGMSFGIAIGGALINNQITTSLAEIPNLSIEAVKNNLSYVASLPPDVQARVLQAYIGALQWVFRGVLIMWGIAAVFVIFIRYRPLSKEALEAKAEI
ncbi:uncharacterized protein VTP21DRAFT_1050 [Calcarisporiella thermophila]|uniref:uncharacterized protein n=1 Tax=Calcarisporiella thermophila TaxID=911321 RepID=UPI00374257DC